MDPLRHWASGGHRSWRTAGLIPSTHEKCPKRGYACLRWWRSPLPAYQHTTAEGGWSFATKGDVRRFYDELGDSLGDFFAGMADWQWFVTCSLGGTPTGGFTRQGLGEARRCLRDLLVRSCAKSVVCVFELQRRDVPHLHALLAGCPAINGYAANEYFYKTHGISRWKIYAEAGGAAKYIGKYLTKDIVELYIGLDGPWEMDDFKVFTGGLTKKGTPKFTWDTHMGGLRV